MCIPLRMQSKVCCRDPEEFLGKGLFPCTDVLAISSPNL